MFECTYVLRGGEEGVREKPMVARRPSSAPQKERWGGYSRHAVVPTYLFRPPLPHPKTLRSHIPTCSTLPVAPCEIYGTQGEFRRQRQNFFYIVREEEEEVSNLVQTDDDAEPPPPPLPIQVCEEKCVLTRDIGKVSGGVSHFAILFLNGTDAAKSSIQCKRAAERTKGRRVENPT